MKLPVSLVRPPVLLLLALLPVSLVKLLVLLLVSLLVNLRLLLVAQAVLVVTQTHMKARLHIFPVEELVEEPLAVEKPLALENPLVAQKPLAARDPPVVATLLQLSRPASLVVRSLLSFLLATVLPL